MSQCGACGEPRQNYLGDHPIPLGHFLVIDAHLNQVSLWTKPGYRVGNPNTYLARYWERRYDLEGSPNDPIPA